MKKPTAIIITVITCMTLIMSTLTVYADDGFPASYDPRDGLTSAVRSQNPWGTCWDFGGISTVESYLILHGMADTTIDLSEEDVLWWANGNYIDPNGDDAGSWTRKSRNDGGYASMVEGYLMSTGVRSEADIPYLTTPSKPDVEATTSEPDVEATPSEPDDEEYYGMGKNVRPANYYTAPSLFEITDIAYINNDPSSIKSAIMTYGAVATSYNDDHLTEKEDGGLMYLNTETGGYWYPNSGEEDTPNHVISVVGWDDNYPRTNFNEINGELPSADGAWLIKNSYGTNFGDGGYIWISYEDKLLFYADPEEDYDFMYSIAGASDVTGDKAYMLDEFGHTFNWYPETGSSTVLAAVYDFGENEGITRLTFHALTAGVPYNIYYAPMNGDTPSADSSSWTQLASGTVDHAGFNTVYTDTPVNIPTGKGAILLSLSCDNPGFGVEANIMRESRCLFTANTSSSSFYLKDGSFIRTAATATDGDNTYEDYFDVCLRAYTTAVEPAPTDTPTPATTDTLTPKTTSVPAGTQTPSATPTSAATHASATKTGNQTNAALYMAILAASAMILILTVRKKVNS